MAEFDLSALMKDVSKSGTGREQIRYIAWENIRPAENNGYSMDGLPDLARSIELVGLQQPLRVRPLADDSVEVISGHRRRAAIGLLIDQGSKRFDGGVPCIVDTSAASPALRELQLLLGNADNRKLTSADEAQQAERISDCIRRLEDEGYEFPGRHRDWVSKLSGMSRSKLARLKVIRDRLAPGLREQYEEGELNESVAYEFSKFDHAKQDQIWDDLAEANLPFTVENVQRAAGRLPKEAPPPTPQTKKLPADSTVWLKPKDAYRRITSIRTAASALGITPEKSIQEQIEALMRDCRSHRGAGGPGYNVELRPPCHVILDEYTRYERRYTIKQFLELVAEVWIENDLNAFQADTVRTPALTDVWYDTEEGDFPDEDIDLADIIAWGDAGLKTVPGTSFLRAYQAFPGRYRWWAVVDGPEEDEDE